VGETRDKAGLNACQNTAARVKFDHKRLAYTVLGSWRICTFTDDERTIMLLVIDGGGTLPWRKFGYSRSRILRCCLHHTELDMYMKLNLMLRESKFAMLSAKSLLAFEPGFLVERASIDPHPKTASRNEICVRNQNVGILGQQLDASPAVPQDPSARILWRSPNRWPSPGAPLLYLFWRLKSFLFGEAFGSWKTSSVIPRVENVLQDAMNATIDDVTL
jgi:hypothetical protein